MNQVLTVRSAALSVYFAVFSCVCVAQSGGVSTPGTGSASSSSSGSGGSSSPAGGGTLSAVPEDFGQIRLGPGFLVSLSVYDVPELDGIYRVDSIGNVALPLAGIVSIGGLSIPEAEIRIRDRFLKTEMLRDPQVTINIQQYAPFFVSITGEVGSVGRIQLLAPHSLLDVLTLSGGLTSLAGDVVEVKRISAGIGQTQTYHYAKGSNGDSIRNVMVSEGDTVIVPRAGIIYVLGAVFHPGGYVMQEQGTINVAEALSMASGTSRDARTAGIRVVRRNADGSIVEIPISYDKISKGKQVPLLLQAQDIVYVPVSKGKSIFTSVAGMITTAESATLVSAK